ncbi:hypothetical protein TOK_4662 [Pseudonocardia sp. N23]|nr:hypothetical protein TOK_4662 [Pseudonocardia sp. N23]
MVAGEEPATRASRTSSVGVSGSTPYRSGAVVNEYTRTG